MKIANRLLLCVLAVALVFASCSKTKKAEEQAAAEKKQIAIDWANAELEKEKEQREKEKAQRESEEEARRKRQERDNEEKEKERQEKEQLLQQERERYASLVTEVAPGVYEGNIYDLLGVQRFTLEELGDRFVYNQGTDTVQVTILDENLEMPVFRSRIEKIHNTYTDIRNYVEYQELGLSVMYLLSEQDINSILFLLRSLDTKQMQQCIIVDRCSTYGPVDIYNGFVKYGGDGEGGGLPEIVVSIPIDPDVVEQNVVFLRDKFYPRLLPDADELKVHDIRQNVFYFRYKEKRTVIGVSERPIPFEGKEQYWFLLEGNKDNYSTTEDFWVPASAIYLQTGTFKNLPRIPMPYDSIEEKMLRVLPKDADNSIQIYSLKLNADSASVSRGIKLNDNWAFTLNGKEKVNSLTADLILNTKDSRGKPVTYYHLDGRDMNRFINADDVTVVLEDVVSTEKLTYCDVTSARDFILYKEPSFSAEQYGTYPGRKHFSAFARTLDEEWYEIYISDEEIYGWINSKDIVFK